MHGRIALAALAAICLFSLTGCEQLCGGTRGVFCPESSSNPLNHPPLATAGGGLLIERRHLPLTAVASGGTLLFEAHYEDPDGDALYYEWDLDGDGDFERAGYGSSARHTYAHVGSVRVKLRVSDFPQYIGAPGVVTETRTVLVVDPARNHAPEAHFGIDPESLISGVPVYFAGAPVFLDGTHSEDPDGYDNGRLSYSFEAYQTDAAGHRLPGGVRMISGDHVSPYWAMRLDRPGRWTIALEVRDAAGVRDVEERGIDVYADTPVADAAPIANFRISPGLPALHQEVTLASSSTDPAPGPGIERVDWDLDGDGRFEVRDSALVRTSFDAPGPRRIGLRAFDGFRYDVIYKDVEVLPYEGGSAGPTGPGSSSGPVASRAHSAPGMPFSARLTGRPLPGGRGERHDRGGKMELLNVLGRGRLHARVLGPSRAVRDVRRFLNAPWRTRARFDFDPRSHRLSASAIALATVRGGASCLRIRVTSQSGGNATGNLTVLGGKGAGARLRATATFRFRLERDGSASVLGHLTTARAAGQRPLPATCRRLTKG